MNEESKVRRSFGNIMSTILLIFSIVCMIMVAIFVFTNTGDRFVFGYKPSIVATGSMEPEYSTYSVVLLKENAYEDIQIGDVIAFKPDELGGAAAMHRVVEKTTEGFITKGDNNDFRDDGYVTKDNYMADAIWHTNIFAGYISHLIQPYGWIIFLVMPILGIILFIFSLRFLFLMYKSSSSKM